ncbi:hypothetical protein [Spiroplasma citri]|uniref:hypothetical protein n=1 Tax=Spiroplasma citri TaxID=2133 RepID=UPI001EE1EBC6|nr:hypothetical protein [Spiroplasma citri]
MLGQKGYSYLGLAKRGGKLITGACLLTAIQQKTVYLVLTSNDVGPAQAKNINKNVFIIISLILVALISI